MELVSIFLKKKKQMELCRAPIIETPTTMDTRPYRNPPLFLLPELGSPN
jgi:hypothetical protein